MSIFLAPWQSWQEKLAVIESQASANASTWRLSRVLSVARSRALFAVPVLTIMREASEALARSTLREVPSSGGQWVQTDVDLIFAGPSDCVERALALLSIADVVEVTARPRVVPQPGDVDHVVLEVEFPGDRRGDHFVVYDPS